VFFRSILKVGVACLDDAKKLSLDHGLIVRGCVDLRHLAARSRITNCRSVHQLIKNISLKSLLFLSM